MNSFRTGDRQSLDRIVEASPALDRRRAFREAIPCKICQRKSALFDIVDFNKACVEGDVYAFGRLGVQVDYWRCLSCGFLFTPFFNDWSASDFAAFIYNEDYIKVDPEYPVQRPEQLAHDLSRSLAGCESARILDFGSGSGTFAKRMREAGFGQIQSYDPFSDPVDPQGLFDIITCFEVIEHSVDPIQTLGQMKQLLKDDGCIIFSQTTQPDDILSARGSWWYLGPRNGHVSTYTEEALVRLGAAHGLVLHRGANIYGYARGRRSRYAEIALRRVGPSFDVLRLYAPHDPAAIDLCYPSRQSVWWFAVEQDDLWSFRWTGSQRLLWYARWNPVALLQIRIPVVRETRAGFSRECRLALGPERVATRMSHGEITAEFRVHGTCSGDLELLTPAPGVWPSDPKGNARRVGLAVPLRSDPRWPPAAVPAEIQPSGAAETSAGSGAVP